MKDKYIHTAETWLKESKKKKCICGYNNGQHWVRLGGENRTKGSSETVFKGYARTSRKLCSEFYVKVHLRMTDVACA